MQIHGPEERLIADGMVVSEKTENGGSALLVSVLQRTVQSHLLRPQHVRSAAHVSASRRGKKAARAERMSQGVRVVRGVRTDHVSGG